MFEVTNSFSILSKKETVTAKPLLLYYSSLVTCPYVLMEKAHFYPLKGPLVYIDSFYYGKTVIAPLGIVMYNVFGKGGPNLYGK